MANELETRQDGIGGLIEDNPLTSGAVVLTSAALAAMAAVTSTSFMWVILDPDGEDGAPEHVKITAHTAGSTTATILRGQNGTVAREHVAGIRWVHGPVAANYAEMPWTVPICTSGFLPVSTVGTWSLNYDDLAILSGYLKNNPAAINDEVNWDVIMSAGIWTVEVLHTRSTDCGIVTVQLDGSSVGTIDLYGTTARNIISSLAGVSVATGGKKRLKFLMATKNASSSNYFANLQHVALKRTA